MSRLVAPVVLVAVAVIASTACSGGSGTPSAEAAPPAEAVEVARAFMEAAVNQRDAQAARRYLHASADPNDAARVVDRSISQDLHLVPGRAPSDETCRTYPTPGDDRYCLVFRVEGNPVRRVDWMGIAKWEMVWGKYSIYLDPNDPVGVVGYGWINARSEGPTADLPKPDWSLVP